MRRAFYLLLLTTALAAGCTHAPDVRYDNPLVLADYDAATVEKVARRLLTDMRFEIIYPSTSPGLVATEPLTGDQWFEFWLKDTVDRDQRLESSLFTIRRRVTVLVKAHEPGAQIAVKVLKERASAPNTAPDNISYSLSLYSRRDQELVRQDELAKSTYHWINMGRDEALEQYLLEKIRMALASGGGT
jgi:hypothetical protein